MTSRGSRRLLLSGNELKERGRREAPFFVVGVNNQAMLTAWRGGRRLRRAYVEKGLVSKFVAGNVPQI
jgi:hypothetical protein